jgi:Domain of unknown function (DUF4388)
MSDRRDELIRIDNQGVAHPIGVVASQRMRPHEGTYRLLPSPAHVILMRYTGEDGQVDAGDGAIVRIAGEIAAPGTICDILALLSQTGWRGILSVHQGPVTREIYLDQGSVLGVKSGEPEERLGRVMYRYGHISEEDLIGLEEAVGAGRRFGEVAVDLGVLTKEQVYKAFSQQITEVVVAALHIGDGTYFFLDGFEDGALPTRQSVSVNSLLMDGVTRMDELAYFTQKVPTVEHVPARLKHSELPSEEQRPVFMMVDGERSVREIGRLTGLGEFETIKKVYGLVQTHHVCIRPPHMSGGPVAVVEAANDVLGLAFKRAESAGTAQELRESLTTYAVGQGVFYDMLLQGAGPDAHGRLTAERVAENALMVAQGGDVEDTLRKLLFDYVSFALFSVGSALGATEERALQRDVDEALNSLRPSN